ncbi:TPA: nuclease domain-containing protein [Yersinia enterocolitica]|nr:DUF1364 family protein [Yersinia enterocolitica]HDL6601725.1 DUF1364 family protein [Yersinia enterocolitica]HDW3131001.1 DUF1364 family protein [Yersinia enterocolitica]HEN3551164.1 DUF1364 family protein [Yersinia enterocolitica]
MPSPYPFLSAFRLSELAYLSGCWGCGACHDECDRRTRLIDSDTARLYHAEGVMRTQYILRKEGKL